MDRIYLDNAATTRLAPEALEAMLPAYGELYGNASSVHAFGREARSAVEAARGKLAKALNADPQEIYFTSGGTESDNWAIFSLAAAGKKKGRDQIITSSIEHHAVLHSCEQLEKSGYTVVYVPVDSEGVIDREAYSKALSERTALVTIMLANNEIGTIEPIQALCEEAHAVGAFFHTDAVQAVGHIPVDVKALGVDALSLSAHKFHGPKGIGALYVKKGVRIDPYQHGGAQERSKRGGTENVPGILGMAAAMEVAAHELAEDGARMTRLRDRLIHGILERIPEVRLNGHPTQRLPGNANVSIRYIEGEALLLRLDMAGVCGSSGSACTSGSLDPSHVLLAIGLPHEIAHGSLRLSLSRYTTEEEIERTLAVLPEVVRVLRDLSPLFAQKKGESLYV